MSFPLRAFRRTHSVYAISLKTNTMDYVLNLKIFTLEYPGTGAGLSEASLLWISVVLNKKQANTCLKYVLLTEKKHIINI